MKTLARLSLLSLLLGSGQAYAFEFGDEEPKTFELHGEFAQLFLWRNDSDFDRTDPYYSEEGQDVGALTTFFKPQLTFRPWKQLELFYESELGMNDWSRNSPDQWYPAADDFIVYKHREFWAKLQFDILDVKAGYQRLRDPSDLFLSHWIGAVSLNLDLMRFRVGLLVGQMPDSTYEGVSITENNFRHDNVTAGVTFAYDILQDSLTLDLGYYYMHDARNVGRPLNLHVPYLGLSYKGDLARVKAVGLLQAGKWENSGLDNIDQTVLAWAVALSAGITTKWVDLALDGFLLSPDDEHDGNSRMGAFFYSGKNSSSTLLLTEDEIRDRYDNVDERLAGRWGGFFLNRAGLAVVDLSVVGKFVKWFSAELIAGVGMALEDVNAGGETFVGLETDLVLRFTAFERAHLALAGHFFLPGKAAAPYVNASERLATDPVFGFQAGLLVDF